MRRIKYVAYFHVSVEDLEDVGKEAEEEGRGQTWLFAAKCKEECIRLNQISMYEQSTRLVRGIQVDAGQRL